ncbi:MAG: rhomboid family intramembrane serine protease [Calditrichia bacterium]
MIPLRDSVRSRSFPLVNVSIIVINVLAFFYELSLGAEVDAFFQAYAFTPTRFLDTLQNEPYNLFALGIPLLTSMFLHGGWMHLIGNMWFLWIFGDNVEDSMGHKRYIIFYLLAGLGAGLVHFLFNPNSAIPTVGASGAIASVMGAYMILYPRGRILTLIPLFIFIQIIEVPAFFFLLFWILLQMFQGVASLGAEANVGGVAWWAHIGGFAIGAVLIFFFRKRGRYRRFGY